MMGEKIKQFFANHSISTHSIATVIAALIGAFYSVPQFHDYVLMVYAHIPKWGKDLIATGIALYMWYRSGRATQPAQAQKDQAPPQAAQFNGQKIP
jgi:hypothetical protein